MTRAVRAPADGYTIAVGNMGTQSAAPALYPNLKYDPAKSFAQVGVVNYAPQAVVSKKALPTTKLKDFIAYVKAGGPTSATATPASARSPMSPAGVQCEVWPDAESHSLSRHRAGADDLVAGQIDYTVDQSLNVIPQIKAGPSGSMRSPRRAAVEPARCSDHEGSRRGLHLQCLERDGRAEGYATGHRREAGRRRSAGARRSDVKERYVELAVRPPRALSGGRRACRSWSRARSPASPR